MPKILATSFAQPSSLSPRERGLKCIISVVIRLDRSLSPGERGLKSVLFVKNIKEKTFQYTELVERFKKSVILLGKIKRFGDITP